MQRISCSILTLAMLGWYANIPQAQHPPVSASLQVIFAPDNPNPGSITISMAPGTITGNVFEIQILVTEIAEFFGAAFRITYDPGTAVFSGFSSAGSFIDTGGVATDFRAQTSVPGTLLVAATRQGQVAGVDAIGSQLLMTLIFEASTATDGSPFAFGTAATRSAISCPEPPAACSDIPDEILTWSGGVLMASTGKAVQIEISPGGFPNSVNPRSRGVVPVAILGRDAFDVTDVDVTTLGFGPAGAAPAHDLTDSFTYNDHLQDVTLDGHMDLVTHYRTQETGIACGDESATLTGIMTAQTPCIDFRPSATPEAGSVVTQKGLTSDCDTAVIDLIVSDVSDVFGAAFDVTYADNLASFSQASGEGSVLASDGTAVQTLAAETSPGNVVVGISRLGGVPGVDVVGSQLLIRLTFDRFGTEGTGVLDFAEPLALFDSSGQVIPGIIWSGGNLAITNTAVSSSFAGSDSITTVGCRATRRPGLRLDEERVSGPDDGRMRDLERN